MADWQGFLRQARRFWEVAEAANDPEHASQAASNAIHAVIAANDAICLYLSGERPTGDSHSQAAQVLQRACRGTQWEEEAAKRARQFAQIMREKNAAEYEGRSLDQETVAMIMRRARRFINWAETILPRLPLSSEEE
ncbi:MAG: HEPN domain-containing protein [Armatimonadota bacterium]